MSMEESISLEETNKIRISLGLKPLTDDAAPANDKDKQAEDNYAKQREREAKESQSKYLHGSLQSMRLVLINLFFCRKIFDRIAKWVSIS
jgi:U4/U6.U5 tri-snRNP-associated protein 1